MTPERWNKLDALFHEALELQGEARAAHLAKVCGDDERLREEADRLIAAHERDGSFMDSPIFVDTEKTTDDDLNEFPVGRRIGPYRVVSMLGQGGMGKVFLAEDTRLERKVAIKVLPAIFTQDPERVRRFEREAKAASALNHPSIYALGGRSEEAVKWLRETAMNGKPNYTLFVRDTFLDRIRQDPAFVSFMAEMKTRWEGYRRAFG